jgi:hypothetical protein
MKLSRGSDWSNTVNSKTLIAVNCRLRLTMMMERGCKDMTEKESKEVPGV